MSNLIVCHVNKVSVEDIVNTTKTGRTLRLEKTYYN